MSKVETALEKIESLGTQPKIFQHHGEPTTLPLRSQLTLAKDQVMAGLDMSNLPEGLRMFWSTASQARLFEDVTYGQWGLILLTTEESQKTTDETKSERAEDFRKGDLIVGKFIGDSDLLLVRTDKSSPDFGEVLIVSPIERRSDWYKVSPSFGEFLEKYVDSNGQKFWEA